MEHEIQFHINQLKTLHKLVIGFIDSTHSEEPFDQIKAFFENSKIIDDHSQLKLIFKMIISISNNHYRNKFL